MQSCIPNENERPLPESLSDNGVGNVYWLENIFKIAGFALGRDNSGRINNYGFDIFIVIVGKTEKKEARLSGDGDADFFSSGY